MWFCNNTGAGRTHLIKVCQGLHTILIPIFTLLFISTPFYDFPRVCKVSTDMTTHKSILHEIGSDLGTRSKYSQSQPDTPVPGEKSKRENQVRNPSEKTKGRQSPATPFLSHVVSHEDPGNGCWQGEGETLLIGRHQRHPDRRHQRRERSKILERRRKPR